MANTARSGQRRAATLNDVARLAGVSIATASKAVNGRAEVAESTRQRVMAAATEIGFTPNALAQSLIAGRTGTVGLLTSDLEGRFVLPILMGAEDAFGSGQISVFLCDARGDRIRENYHLKALLNRRVDGIIVVGRSTDPRPSLGHDLPVPVVYAYAPSDDPTDRSLTPDNVVGGRLAVEHVLSFGRRRIAHITGDVGYAAALDRAEGFREGLAAAGVTPVAEPMFGSWTEGWGRDAAAMLLDRHPDIDGFVCGSDQIARGALETLRDYGRSVPEDVSVIGYDNWEVLAVNSRPELTSIDCTLQELGRRAAQRIFEAIDGGPLEGGTEYVAPKIVMRGSTVASR
ncbi:LacI family DNA-binding transcriptional regulator [Herbiconiux flava]|uniref:LacI family transcriptional regulator n=1 Tax=Herbiconiux flava TaxID=881268 RepID=A0A852S9K7_9MICO|nr:LacI family DNA-binding transcriptional regulator [Herbiconiux flava]NYD69032.1 LacI family transcriptional regulator [Herbiconiux flava]GLK15780.1 LacI family transcriptional regulator [Herbiconiux flava]